MSRRAKIVCTLGPASSSPEELAKLVAAGLDVARLNMSHGSQAGHLEVYRAVRRASDEAGRSVGVLVDLQGPKIRLGSFASGPVRLAAGQSSRSPARTFPATAPERLPPTPAWRPMSGRGTRSSSTTAASSWR